MIDIYLEKINKFLNFLQKEKNYSSNTIISYKTDILEFFYFLTDKNKNIPFENIDVKIVREFLDFLYKKHIKPTSISRKISSMKSFIKFLINHDFINNKNNPFLYIRSPKKPKTIPIFLSIYEMFDLLNAPKNDDILGIRDRAIFEILYSTGIRVSELIAIKIKDIDIFAEIVKITGKGNKERLIPIGKDSLRYIKKYIDISKKTYFLTNDDFLFRNKKGEHINIRSISRIINNYIKILSIKKHISPHKIRHTFASHLINAGCDIRSIQELLGHKNLATTQIYSHLEIQKLKSDFFNAHPHSH